MRRKRWPRKCTADSEEGQLFGGGGGAQAAVPPRQVVIPSQGELPTKQMVSAPAYSFIGQASLTPSHRSTLSQGPVAGPQTVLNGRLRSAAGQALFRPS